MNIDLDKILDFVRSIKPMFLDHERAAHIQRKGVADFVTQVDLQVQETVQQGLKEMYPQVQFMGEEKSNEEIDFAKPLWILDPVDGTTNLIHDLRHSALSLAYCEGGQLQMGIIYQPYSDEMFWAVRGQGAWLNGRRIRVTVETKLENSLVAFGTSPYRKDLAEENFALFKQVFECCADVRRLGSAALDLAYVACGRYDAFFEQNLSPWDFAAGVLLVQEAGGTVTDYQGNPVILTGKCDICAGNGRIDRLLNDRVLGKRRMNMEG